MAKSRRLIQLQSRISFLENNILPKERILGNYTKKENDLIRSYVLLVHAEIEAYFEDRAKEKANYALVKWVSFRKKSSCLKSILAFAGNDISYEGIKKSDSNNIEFRINKAVTHFINLINKNNGVKQNNILNIIIPLGIELYEIDNTWLSVMDTFGSIRGNIAHSSLRVQNQIDRNTERDRVNLHILPEIERLDTLIRKLD
jgi:hypothetical protein